MNYPSKLILRLIIIFLPFPLFEFLATKITLYPSFLILKLLQPTFLLEPFIFFNNTIVEFIPACAASLAYYLLFILILLTKDIKLRKRIKIFLLGSLVILIVNLIRILFLVLILDKYGIDYFNYFHLFFWSFIGSILIAIIWILLIRHYNINSIPFYSDFKYLLKKTKLFK